ncbi:hypothetical protein ABZU32_33435 [Sphaerisporangium sp. NPDC005288]|uniref:hypothetical protein n=1 Tax=Sphaerisporangium sp. NPDC005288 TaxID=3155114 RepID=UPI0033AF0F6F
MLDIEDCLTDILAIPGALDALVIEDTGGTDSKAVAAGRTVTDLDPQESAAALRRTLRATLVLTVLAARGANLGLLRMEGRRTAARLAAIVERAPAAG